MRRSTIICLCLGVICCSLFDLIASFLFYQSNPIYFIAHETSQEAVSFFVDGSFPLVFIFNLLFFPITILAFLWWIDNYTVIFSDEKFHSKLATIAKNLFIIAMVLYCFSRVTAGLTWYDGNTYLFNTITSTFHQIIIGTLLSSIALVSLLVFRNVTCFSKVEDTTTYQ